MSAPLALIRSLVELVNAIDDTPDADASYQRLGRAIRSALDTYNSEPATGDALEEIRRGARLAGFELCTKCENAFRAEPGRTLCHDCEIVPL